MDTLRTSVLGVPVDSVDMTIALQKVRAMLESDFANTIVAVNPEKIVSAQRDPDLLRTIEDASLVIPDGIGVVLAARILGGVKMKRVPGADLMPEICRTASESGHSVFLFGAKPEIVVQAATVLHHRFPGLRVAGTQDGYVPEERMSEVVEAINCSGASILFVALGSPRQELWMNRFRGRLRVRVCQGVGGSFDALCGAVRRAPVFVQRMHLEWFYRLLSEPHRLRRQSALPLFVYKVIKQALARDTDVR